MSPRLVPESSGARKVARRVLGSLLLDRPARFHVGLLAVACLASGAGMLALVALQRWAQGGSPRAGGVQAVAAGLLVVGASLLALRRLRGGTPACGTAARVGVRTRATELRIPSLCLAVGIVASPAIAWLALWRTAYETLDWYYNAFYDKRWVLALFWLAVGVVLVLPAVLQRVADDLRTPGDSGTRAPIPSTDADPAAGVVAGRAGSARGRLLTVTRLLLAVALAWLFYGPPWRIAEMPLPLDFHETIHLSGIQAIDMGRVPFTEAPSMYGPGSQLLLYAYMRGFDFSVAGLREWFAAVNFVCAAIVFGFLLLRLRGLALGVALLVVLSFSPFALWWFGTANQRTFFGWANSARYLGLFLLIAPLPGTVVAWRRGRGSRARVFGLGLVWGVLCWVAPESLVAGVLGCAIFLVLAWATRSLGARDAGAIAAWLAVGLGVSWLPVLAWYLQLGQLAELVQRLLGPGSLIASGWANQPWRPNVPGLDYTLAYYVSPYVFLFCGLVALRPAAGRGGSAPGRVGLDLLAASVICLAAFTASLTRSDEWHLLGSMIGFPLLCGTALEHVPGVLGRTRRTRAALAGVLVLVLLLLYPLSPLRTLAEAVRSLARPFWGAAAQSVVPGGIRGLPTLPVARLPAVRSLPIPSRLGFHFPMDEPCCRSFLLGAKPTMSQLLEATARLGAAIGHRRVVISLPFAGYIYFLADLRPGSIHTEQLISLQNSALRRQWLESFDPADVDCVLTEVARPDGPVLQRFARSHPADETLRLPYVSGDVNLTCTSDVTGDRPRSHRAEAAQVRAANGPSKARD